MKKLFVLFFLILGLVNTSIPASGLALRSTEALDDAQAVLEYLIERNEAYAYFGKNEGDISRARREDTALNGQFPYAIIVTCSDSRVSPEHIFGAGIGELFVIRTAGNVLDDFALGSVEYGAEHLGARVVLVLGHTGCGAVEAALAGSAHGYIKAITDEIAGGLWEGCSAEQAEILNVTNSIEKIRESELIKSLEANGSVVIQGALYDTFSGLVEYVGE
jgi:carbonic anhydrase